MYIVLNTCYSRVSFISILVKYNHLLDNTMLCNFNWDRVQLVVLLSMSYYKYGIINEVGPESLMH